MSRKERPREKWVSTFISNMGNPQSPYFYLQIFLVALAFLIFFLLQQGITGLGSYKVREHGFK